MIAVIEGRHCCYTTPNGIRRDFLGCSHTTPRAAIRHDVPVYVSPLRASGLELTTVPVPLSGAVAVGSKPEPRSTVLRQGTRRP